MSQPMVPAARGHLPLRHRPPVLIATGAARLIVTLKPHRIRGVLSMVRRGAAPATASQTLAAREAVVALSARCAGEGCLQRSVATALLCRMRGVWPDWCTGVRTSPFRAHAWVEVDGLAVGEPHQSAAYHRMMVVSALPQKREPEKHP
ncbi:lasso peptide biosynthesis B2 protein [Streptomyces sp. NPDC002763]|uniref:lasso peptide biosynthesis B2 protein n=1 Tax=Streptomyces sp. NPDC002763 TaxID=3154427 RepID=UPI003318BB02